MSDRTVTVATKVEPDTARILRELAAREHRTVSDHLRLLIDRELDAAMQEETWPPE